ncbi:hypothetical protein ACRARH_24810 [Phytobacter ursingii]
MSKNITDRHEAVTDAIAIAEELVNGSVTFEEVKRSGFFDKTLTISPKTRKKIERITFEKDKILSVTIEREYKDVHLRKEEGWYEADIIIHNKADLLLLNNCDFFMKLNLTLKDIYKEKYNYGPGYDEFSYYVYSYEKKSGGNVYFHFMVSQDNFVNDSSCPEGFYMVKVFSVRGG